jgi:hypothetical protein
VFAPSNRLGLSKSMWHKYFDILIDQFVAHVPREREEDFVHVANITALVKQSCPVGKRLQQFQP